MSQIKCSEGIVLRKFDYSNTSIILHLLTEKNGIIHLIARGAKGAKSQYKGKLDLFNQIRCHYIANNKTDLFILKECSIIDPNKSIKQNINLFFVCSLMFEIITSFPWDNNDLSTIYNLVTQIFCQLHKTNPIQTLIFFEIKILTILGYSPNAKNCSVCGKEITDAGLPTIYDQPGFLCERCNKNKNTSDEKLHHDRLSEITTLISMNDLYELEETKINNKNARKISSTLIFFIEKLSGKNLKSAKMIDKFV